MKSKGGAVERANAAIIRFTETAYDLALGRGQWLQELLRWGAPFLDDGLGLAALTCRRDAERKTLSFDEVRISSCPDDFLVGLGAAKTGVPPSFFWAVSRPTVPMTLSEAAAGEEESFSRVMQHFPDAEDGLGMSGFDPDGNGVYLVAPLRKRTTLSEREREHLQMVAAHFGAGYRLRRALDPMAPAPESELPCNAEAVLDPTTFRVSDALGAAANAKAADRLREAAKNVDRARGQLGRDDPQAALELWTALVKGRWSMVDWFDHDDRRFVLALPNAPNVDDPRGLTEQEAQVISYVVAGHTNKLIGYQLGLSKARISTLVSSSMRKIGARTRAELVTKWRAFDELETAAAS
jgi:DNA-binding CsgD family transcriptional regulator